MQKKITLIFGFMLLSLGVSYAQRTVTTEQIRKRNFVVTSTETNNRGGCVESPYDESDPAYQETIAYDPYCCDTEWDALCDSQYQYFLNGCDAESPYEADDVNYITVVLLDDFCCSTQWDAQCEFHYEHVIYGCNALSPYGPADPVWETVIMEDDFCCDNEWDEICQELYDQYSSGVGIESNSASGFALYPNPASNMVKVRLSNSSENMILVQVYNNSGVLVMEVTPSQNDVVLNTEQLSAGSYHIVVSTTNHVLNQKLVLMK